MAATNPWHPDVEAKMDQIDALLARNRAIVASWGFGEVPVYTRDEREAAWRELALEQREPPGLGVGCRIPEIDDDTKPTAEEHNWRYRSLRKNMGLGLQASKPRNAPDSTAIAAEEGDSSEEETGRSGLGRNKSKGATGLPKSKEQLEAEARYLTQAEQVRDSIEVIQGEESSGDKEAKMKGIEFWKNDAAQASLRTSFEEVAASVWEPSSKPVHEITPQPLPAAQEPDLRSGVKSLFEKIRNDNLERAKKVDLDKPKEADLERLKQADLNKSKVNDLEKPKKPDLENPKMNASEHSKKKASEKPKKRKLVEYVDTSDEISSENPAKISKAAVPSSTSEEKLLVPGRAVSIPNRAPSHSPTPTGPPSKPLASSEASNGLQVDKAERKRLHNQRKRFRKERAQLRNERAQLAKLQQSEHDGGEGENIEKDSKAVDERDEWTEKKEEFVLPTVAETKPSKKMRAEKRAEKARNKANDQTRHEVTRVPEVATLKQADAEAKAKARQLARERMGSGSYSKKVGSPVKTTKRKKGKKKMKDSLLGANFE